jgi:SAM-dependent methyltransferase
MSTDPKRNLFQDQVSQERWLEAQSWEEKHWVHTQNQRARFGKNWIWKGLAALGLKSKHRGDDWNGWWENQFNHYTFLPDTIENALEVGCGPYTNIRLVQKKSRINHLFLSDPLIRTYVTFKLTYVRDMYERAACILDDHSLEELPFASDYFDLTLMINVLDHVRDAKACMEQLIRTTKPGGFMILGQDLSNEEDLQALSSDVGLVGHPIKLDHTWFAPYLKHFEPVHHKLLSRQEGREPKNHYGTLIFAGRKI